MFIKSSLTCLRQGTGMNNVSELVITTITPNGSATLPFVIPSEAEGSAVSASQYQMLTGKPFVHREQLTCRGQVGRGITQLPLHKKSLGGVVTDPNPPICVIPSTFTCLRQVKGEMTRQKSP